MAEKTPGKPRKSTSSRKKETAQQSSQKTSSVTPIDQAGLGQNQGRITQGPPISGQSESSPRSTQGQTSPAGVQPIGGHPSADQSGASNGSNSSPNPIAKQSGSNPSVLNPRGSVQEGSHAAGVKQGGQDLHERIRARAYELFEQRGRREGFHQEDWAQAEAEVLAEFEREKSA
jgi:Protein of unknown function (DUF2934)